MAISLSLLEYLEWEGVDYELLHHAFVSGSMRTAQMAHIPGDKLAKCVVLEDEKGYLMAILPATHTIEVDTLKKQVGRNLQFASEKEIKDLFEDCSTGAIPPMVKAFGYDAVVDESLTSCDEVYFEAGDHTELVHMSGKDFQTLMADMPHYSFSQHI
jgi:Ala-tRNA(Pro) deacylase